MPEELNQKPNGRLKLLIGLVVVLLLAAGGGYYYWSSHRVLTAEEKSAQGEIEMKKVVAKIGKLIMLPGDEGGQPALYEVSDPQMLSKQQAFFKDASKGDRLLIYPKSGRAILYNPTKNILVNVGPVTFDQNAAAAQGSAKASGSTGSKPGSSDK